MRLIDANEFIEYLGLNAENSREENLGEIVTLEDFDRQPTAYDAEKIVEQLEEEKEQSYADFETYVNNTNPNLDSEYDDFFHKGLGRAIDIIRAGGKE